MSIYLQYCRPVGHRGAAVALLSDPTREQPRSVPVPKKKTDGTGLEFRGVELNLGEIKIRNPFGDIKKTSVLTSKRENVFSLKRHIL